MVNYMLMLNVQLSFINFGNIFTLKSFSNVSRQKLLRNNLNILDSFYCYNYCQ